MRAQARTTGPRTRTHVRYNKYMREEDVRATDIGMVPLGYGRFVRADEIVAVLPIEDGRGRGRRTYVHVAGLATPIVASRSEDAILADMKTASRSGRRGTQSDDRPAARDRRTLIAEVAWSSVPDATNRDRASSVDAGAGAFAACGARLRDRSGSEMGLRGFPNVPRSQTLCRDGVFSGRLGGLRVVLRSDWQRILRGEWLMRLVRKHCRCGSSSGGG